jgi:5-methylcytosine-specific restriction protein A
MHKSFRYTQSAPSMGQVQRIRGRAHVNRLDRLRRSNPLCVHCERDGLVTEAAEWDHVIPLSEGGIDHESNLQGLCREHHAAKTRTEARQRFAARGCKVRIDAVEDRPR